MAIRQLKPYLKSIADAIREKTTDAVNLLDFKTARNRDGYTDGVITFTDTGLTYIGNYYFLFDMDLTFFEIGKDYIFSVESYSNSNEVVPMWYLIYEDGSQYGTQFNKPITVTKKVKEFYIRIATGAVAANNSTLIINKPMLEEGEHAHKYIPYGYKEPINAQDFPSKITEVYEKGKQTEYDRFWDEYQAYGTRTFYSQGFAGDGWKNKTFHPKYPIITNAAPNRSNGIFMYSGLTEIMTPLYFYDTTAVSTFAGCTKLIKIGDDTGGGIWQTRNRTDGSSFSNCRALTEIRFLDYNEKGEYVPSEIGNSINFSACPLSVASMKNIIAHLVNYSGTSSSGANTLTFSADCWTRLETDSSAPDGGLWSEYVQSLGWNI